MPTPEALEAAAEFLWPLYTDENMPRPQFAAGSIQCQKLALALDRFAAQRGAEADRLVHLFAKVIAEGDDAFSSEDWEATLCEAERINRGPPPQTGEEH